MTSNTDNIVNRLMVRRSHGAASNHDGAFTWPDRGFVSIRPNETFNSDPYDCGPGLYGYSCHPDHAIYQDHAWRGDQWRAWLASSPPVICAEKAKAAEGCVAATGDARFVARIVRASGADVPRALTMEHLYRADLMWDPTWFDRFAVALAMHAADRICQNSAAIKAEVARREAVRAGLARIGRAIGAAVCYEAQLARQWYAVTGAAYTAEYLSRRGHVPTAENLALHAAGFSLDYPDAGRPWLALGMTQTDKDAAYAYGIHDAAIWHAVRSLPADQIPVAAATLALPGVPVKTLATIAKNRACRASEIVSAWNRGDGHTVKAVILPDGCRAPKTMFKMRAVGTIAVYLPGSSLACQPDGWIAPADLDAWAKRTKRQIKIVNHDWRAAAKRQDDRMARAKRQADRLAGRQRAAYDKAMATIMDGVYVRNGRKSWGRVTEYRVTVTLPDGRSASDVVGCTAWDDIDWRIKVVAKIRAQAMVS